VLYFVHALYWRDGYMAGLWGKQRRCGLRCAVEVAQGLFLVWGLALLAVAWCIGVSRYRDNRHNIDDILVRALSAPRGAGGAGAWRVLLWAVVTRCEPVRARRAACAHTRHTADTAARVCAHTHRAASWRLFCG
jgi:hypothetical protein